jgi:uncharacterized coiled-coil protein SlyX
LRESELESRLYDREQRQAGLEAQLQDFTTLLRKEQATRDAQARRIAALEGELLARPPSTRRKAQPRPPHRRKAQGMPLSERNATKTRKTSARSKSKSRSRR